MTSDRRRLMMACFTASGGGGGLPAEYQQVEYIYSPQSYKYGNYYGNAPYLLLGIQTNFLGYDIDFQYDNTNRPDTPRLVGSFRWGGGNYGTFGLWSGIYWAMQTGANRDSDFTLAADDLRHRLQYRVSENNWSMDGVVKQTNLTTPSANSVDIGLFCTYDSAQTRPPFFATGGFKVFSAKFYSAYSLVRDLVPCYRIADSKPGMYDLVGGVFYVNQSSGNIEFTVGSDV